LFIEGLKYVILENKIDKVKLKFLVDTGATSNVIKLSSVCKNVPIRPCHTVFKGIAGKFKTIGRVQISWAAENFNGTDDFSVASELPLDADGILGATFIDKYKSIINNENLTFTLKLKELEICLPLLTKRNFEITLPPRSESFHKCMVCEEDESVIISEEVCEGVFAAGALVRPIAGQVWVKFLNTRESSVVIRNYNPRILMASEFEIKSFEKKDVLPERVKKLIDMVDLSGMTSEEKDSVRAICAKYSDVFYMENDPMTSTHIYRQSIRLKPNANPIYVKPYRIPHSQRQEIEKQVNQMLKDDIIEESRSEWSSPILLVPKKPDGNGNKKWRLVIDYRRLNEQLQDEKFPLANITDILDSLCGAVYFTTLDLNQGYYQLEINERDRPCTAFVTDKGQYQLKKLPMGLKISPSAFSKMMTVAMSGLNYENCFVYLDDIIVFGRNIQEHGKNLMAVLDRLRGVNLKLNPKKSQFLRKSVLYLGHQISEQGILPDPAKIETVKNYPRPTDADGVKRFVAFANYYRKFIKDFSSIAYPLNKLSRKNVKFEWSEDCQSAFDKLKEKLVSPVVLDYPDLTESNIFKLTTDASKIGLGAVLANSNGRPVAFTSRALNKQEQNYSTTEIEILAIVWAIKHFRPYLFGRYFEIFTDHRPLIYLFTQVDPSSRLNKFRHTLMGYNFSVTYVKGKENVVADALSRITIQELIELESRINNSRVFAVTRLQEKARKKKEEEESIKKELKKNSSLSDAECEFEEPNICEILKEPKDMIRLKVYEEIDREILEKYRNITIRAQTAAYIIEKSTVYLFWPTSGGALERISVLQDMVTLCSKVNIKELVLLRNKNNEEVMRLLKNIRELLQKKGIRVNILKDIKEIRDDATKQLILNDFHIIPTSGHAGVSRMSKNIKKYYFWTGIDKDVKDYVKKCDSCQRFKHSAIRKQPMVVTTTATMAFSKIFLDLIGPFEKDAANNVYALTTQCELSKFVTVCPLVNKEASTVARAFVEHFVLKFGMPQEIGTDCGTEFTAELTQNVCKLLHIKSRQSTPYHHESVGALENSHKHLGAFMRAQIAKHGGSWGSWLQYWAFSYNTAVHSETEYTPYELVFGKLCSLPLNVVTGDVEPLYNPDDYLQELKYRLKVAHREGYRNLIVSKNKRKDQFDEQTKEVIFRPGELVLLRKENRKKLDDVYIGPFEVIQDEDPNVELKIKNKTQLVHKNRIKPYICFIE
jgi:hypothetical protein